MASSMSSRKQVPSPRPQRRQKVKMLQNHQFSVSCTFRLERVKCSFSRSTAGHVSLSIPTSGRPSQKDRKVQAEIARHFIAKTCATSAGAIVATDQHDQPVSMRLQSHDPRECRSSSVMLQSVH
ncbi:uncharacterized protein LOC119736071 [Patiria miniata]|uniref:Uncharacterized protein n=1 Tax=Patiria miniata TaxID=46514 RepID=A0A914AMZ5_PATMI|nr:uncharacterized protein LOC119735484 [Patiria miniata]XP_038065118.1 uncharacterized protein LOC119735485 [Patiria miniata]XP_038066008.1 uncharacterized protein LOC119736071 [Patiria miniata]